MFQVSVSVTNTEGETVSDPANITTGETGEILCQGVGDRAGGAVRGLQFVDRGSVFSTCFRKIFTQQKKKQSTVNP